MTTSKAFIQIRCGEDFKAEIEAASAKLSLSVSAFVREAVEEKIAGVEGGERTGGTRRRAASTPSVLSAPSATEGKRSYTPDFKGPKEEPKRKRF